MWEEDKDVHMPEVKVQRIVWIGAGACMVFSALASFSLIRGHVRHYTRPNAQSKIIGILWMVPIYTIDSWLSLRFKGAALYLDLMRDSYEAYVIYLFLALMVAYLGAGSDEKVIELLHSVPEIPQPWPLRKWRPPIRTDASFLHDCKRASMQFVILKPFMAAVAILLHVNGKYTPGNFSPANGYIYVSLIVNASITYAFYYLVLFYVALHAHLAPFNPVPKFLCIKAVLFLSFWQSVILAFLSRFHLIHELGSWTVENVTTGIQNVLICFEMCFVAIAHYYAFPYEPYVGLPSAKIHGLSDHLALDDAVRDFNQVMPVVLPTPFKPSASVVRGDRRYRFIMDDVSSEQSTRLLDDDYEGHSGRMDDDVREKEVAAPPRGWRL